MSFAQCAFMSFAAAMLVLSLLLGPTLPLGAVLVAYLLMETHQRNWTVWQFAWRVTLGALVLLISGMLIFGG
ncbi:MAG: hypothetical protein KGN32_00340 [Burkholderiales bacterium]|nr:hypothetical protein [Burkholderiales bacterium]